MTLRLKLSMLTIALLLFVGGANAQNINSTAATVTLKMNIAETISITASPATVNFTYTAANGTAAADRPITVTGYWNLSSSRTPSNGLNVLAWLGSASAALSDGVPADNVPSSDFFISATNGRGDIPLTACSLTSTWGSVASVAGAACPSIWNAPYSQVGFVGNTGSLVITPSLSGLSTNLPANLYTGTLYIEIGAM